VTGRLESTEYRKMGGTLDRAIVTVLRGSTGLNRFVDPDTRKEAHSNSPRGTFAFELPPGDYRVQCTGVGSRGATFLPTYKTFTVQAGAKTLDVGAIDLPASKVTRLFGQPAPELLGVAAWKNTDTLTLKSLRGQVVVVDFWSYACSICHHHKPDLIRLAERYKGKGLVVLTMHDNSVSSIEEMDREMESVVKNAWRGKPLGLPIGLDGKGADSVFQAFGVFAVPTVLLIDADGKVVRRFAHAGAPDLEAEVAKLLKRK
jgi:thiol-disulfide isomerase/thioredoxin